MLLLLFRQLLVIIFQIFPCLIPWRAERLRKNVVKIGLALVLSLVPSEGLLLQLLPGKLLEVLVVKRLGGGGISHVALRNWQVLVALVHRHYCFAPLRQYVLLERGDDADVLLSFEHGGDVGVGDVRLGLLGLN